jgi:hypothetical protein
MLCPIERAVSASLAHSALLAPIRLPADMRDMTPLHCMHDSSTWHMIALLVNTAPQAAVLAQAIRCVADVCATVFLCF